MKIHKPLVSIIIPVFNVQEYLDICIHSVRRQTVNEIQIILVDDGSTDRSSAICDQHELEDKRILVIHKPNGGLVSARKAGLEKAIGKYSTFVDGDDWIDENTVEQFIPYLMEHESVDIVSYGCKEEYPDRQVNRYNSISEGVYRGEALEELKNHLLLGDNFFEWCVLPHLCDKIIKTDILQKALEQVSNLISFGEDAACSFPCILMSHSFCSLNFSPYHYRQRDGSIVKSTKELNKAGFCQLYATLSKAFAGRELLLKDLKLYLFFVLCLKAYSQIGSSFPLFPFEKVNLGSRVYVYGAGGFGKVVKSFIETSKDLELAGWSDGNADFYRSMGYDVKPKEVIDNKEFDILVIAVLNERIADEIKCGLLCKGISPDKIDVVRKQALCNQVLPEWLTH